MGEGGVGQGQVSEVDCKLCQQGCLDGGEVFEAEVHPLHAVGLLGQQGGDLCRGEGTAAEVDILDVGEERAEYGGAHLGKVREAGKVDPLQPSILANLDIHILGIPLSATLLDNIPLHGIPLLPCQEDLIEELENLELCESAVTNTQHSVVTQADCISVVFTRKGDTWLKS